MEYGDARVSTDGRSVDAQARHLRAEGCKAVFRKWRAEPRPTAASSALATGDVLMVTILDRLAQSTRDLLNTLAAVTDRKVARRRLGRQHHAARPPDAHRADLAEFERGRDAGEPVRKIARSYNVHGSTISRLRA